MTALYDTIGKGYRDLRRPDSRIEEAVRRGLADAPTVVNVGAGTGSYEPTDRPVVAVEPSRTMLGQRPSGAAPAVQASAGSLPFRDGAFGAALAVLTVHHWEERRKGLRELRRVSRGRVVLLTWDPAAPPFWLTDYFPEILDVDRRIFPSMEELRRELGPVTVTDVLVPYDCSDGFLGAYWRRPEAYLDARIRSAISTFSKVRDASEGLRRLRQDLESEEWRRRYGSVLSEASLDLGYRLVVGSGTAP